MNIEINLDDHLQEVLQESKQRLTANLESWLESSDVTIYPTVLRDLSLIDTEIQDRLFGIRRLMISSGAPLSVSVRIELAKIKALAQFCTAANSALDHQRALYKQLSEPAVFTPTSEAVESVLVADEIHPSACGLSGLSGPELQIEAA